MGRQQEEMDERARARSSWPGGLYTRGQEPSDDIGDVTTPEQRLARVWPLTVAAWRAAGLPIPDYDRAHMPARLFQPGDRPDDDVEP
jgi:hypothetical protein